jgi:uncharacterized membrane protein (UPF0127 family)
MRLKIGDNIFNVKVVHTDADRSEGMMNKTFTDNYNGMLFLMDDDVSCFWMKNCIIPLDIIFIHGTTITKIHHNCPPCKSDNDNECDNYCGKGRMILEVDGGSCHNLNIKKGESIKLLV